MYICTYVIIHIYNRRIYNLTRLISTSKSVKMKKKVHKQIDRKKEKKERQHCY